MTTQCPCVPASLCRPLSPQPPKTRKEVVAYHGGHDPKTANAWSAAGIYNNGSLWRSYDWSKVTTIGLFADMDGLEGWRLLCTAHKHRVRVLPWSGVGTGGRPNPIAQPYEAYRYQHREVFSNRSYVDAHATASAAFVVSCGFDGILLDAEGLHGVPQDPVGSLPRLRTGLVYWAARLRQELDRALPGSLLTWTVGQNATSDDVVRRSYDYLALSKYIDFFQPMEYCNSGDVGLGGRLPRQIYYSSRSNDPLYTLNMTVHTYRSLGIATQQLVMLLPWFGSDFLCASRTNCSRLVWVARDPAWFGGQCGQAIDGGPSYGQALAILSNSTTLGYSVTERMWDDASKTNYFEWVNVTPNQSGVSDGRRHQLWYDDARSFGIKARMAKVLGLHGIGIWLPELVASETQAADMWRAVPSFS